jgi:hypothetical protein
MKSSILNKNKDAVKLLSLKDKPLEEIFGMKFEPLSNLKGLNALKAFASKHKESCVFSRGKESVEFSTEDATFAIRTDLNEDLETVFKGTITTYCPKQELFGTTYTKSFEKCLAQLAEGCKAAYKIEETN